MAATSLFSKDTITICPPKVVMVFFPTFSPASCASFVSSFLLTRWVQSATHFWHIHWLLGFVFLKMASSHPSSVFLFQGGPFLACL